ncbi:hypothetical protein ONS95_013440 [Cadophora gregata]|uniref:uncharacterized protein n=1 Tax=Cadophora gregata TaxID=51156 RepID=UPI0026DD0811|nr:uncharacterized protein ONS95_013440 [Cadophora gregata]KAK0099667.1 hypothetical protein ONS96_008163 [Cadophora gregata f. sp. sojae]KAK0116420.1 hypothetical protein ONS95_013440 [Cadophora gregata]
MLHNGSGEHKAHRNDSSRLDNNHRHMYISIFNHKASSPQLAVAMTTLWPDRWPIERKDKHVLSGLKTSVSLHSALPAATISFAAIRSASAPHAWLDMHINASPNTTLSTLWVFNAPPFPSKHVSVGGKRPEAMGAETICRRELDI